MLTRFLLLFALALIIPIQSIAQIYFAVNPAQDLSTWDLHQAFYIGSAVCGFLILLILVLSLTVKSEKLLYKFFWKLLHLLLTAFCIVYPAVSWTKLTSTPPENDAIVYWIWGGLVLMMGISSVSLWFQ